jgi:hypothetical protein
VNLATLASTFEPKLLELDLLYTWNEELVPTRVDAGGNLVEELLTAAHEFEELMTTAVGDSSLRKMLAPITKPGETSRVGEAHRRFATELRARSG